jgi:nucleoside-diphosphate kinase
VPLQFVGVSDALIIFKPDSAHRAAVRAALWNWLKSEREWTLLGMSWFQPPAELLDEHYDFLRGRPFFPWLVEFMTALPVVVGRVSTNPDGLEHMRHELGETRIPEARPGSLRERYGIGGGVNVLHLSDSLESGAREVALWAGRLDLARVDAGLETATDRPDHTYHLRSLASQYANGVYRDLAGQEIRRLLAEESELVGGDLDTLFRIVAGAFD